MKKKFLTIFLVVVSLQILFSIPVSSQEEENTYSVPKTEYFKAKVIDLISDKSNNDPNDPAYSNNIQEVRLIFTNGPEKGSDKNVVFYPKSSDEEQKLKVGEMVVVTKVTDNENIYYAVSDRYRLDRIWWLALMFIFLVFAISRYKGFGSLLGLAFSLLVIAKFIVPQILAGKDPLIICLIGSIAIALVSIYVAHGFRLRTTLAVISTIITIAITLLLDYVIIHWLKLFGAGTEEAIYAQFLQTGTINLRGLLLGGIIIGVLGVLDDITTAQAAVVDELRSANPAFTFKELYSRGMSVGKEHIASLINTLVLAYVGASFPLVLLFQQFEQPITYIINSELVAEEIARTLIGSSALILAVPLTTALTAYVLIKYNILTKHDPHAHSHSHHS